MRTTNVENNPGPASMVMLENEKGLQVVGATIIALNDIRETPLEISNVKTHICEIDADKKVARRKYDGKIVNADFSKMKEARDTRKEQGRDIKEIVSYSEFEKRKAEKEGKIENIDEIKASKKPAKVSGMEIGE